MPSGVATHMGTWVMDINTSGKQQRREGEQLARESHEGIKRSYVKPTLVQLQAEGTAANVAIGTDGVIGS